MMKKYYAIKGNSASELKPIPETEMDKMFKKERWGMPEYYCIGAVFKVYPFPADGVIFATAL